VPGSNTISLNHKKKKKKKESGTTIKLGKYMSFTQMREKKKINGLEKGHARTRSPLVCSILTYRRKRKEGKSTISMFLPRCCHSSEEGKKRNGHGAATLTTTLRITKKGKTGLNPAIHLQDFDQNNPSAFQALLSPHRKKKREKKKKKKKMPN